VNDSVDAVVIDPAPRELTPKVFIVGIILGILMTATNAYLGLTAGMTVSASIPAAVISMLALRGLQRIPEINVGGKRLSVDDVTILENNAVQTMASAGESLAAGVIFTIPALLVMGIWDKIELLDTFIIAMLGGILGTMFTISLRKIFIVEEALPYPEGVACSDVLIAGEKGGKGLRTVVHALGIGAIFGWMVKGFHLVKERVAGAVGAGDLRFYAGADLSLALVSVGAIVGLRIAGFILLGGVVAFVILVPLIGLTLGWPTMLGGVQLSWSDSAMVLWSQHVRYIGVGAMVVGGVWTLFSMRKTIFSGFMKALRGTSPGDELGKIEQADRDLPGSFVLTTCLVIVVLTFLFEWWRTESLLLALAGAGFLAVAAFFFSAVGGYIAGVVGSSNSPVSGMTIATILFAAGVTWFVGGVVLGMGREELMFATLVIASIVAVNAAIAGDVMQDLKTGHIVGATPWRQQIAEIVGVVTGAIVIAPILYLLNEAFRITKTHCIARNAAAIASEQVDCAHALTAPQAELIGAVISGIFGGQINTPMVVLGALIAVIIIMLRLPVMSVAIGLYLPLDLSIPIAVGGILAALLTGVAHQRASDAGEQPEKAEEEVRSRLVLVGAGLIAGESVMGVVIALFLVLDFPPSQWLPLSTLPMLLSLIVFGWFIGLLLILASTALPKSVGGIFHDLRKVIQAALYGLKQQLFPAGNNGVPEVAKQEISD